MKKTLVVLALLATLVPLTFLVVALGRANDYPFEEGDVIAMMNTERDLVNAPRLAHLPELTTSAEQGATWVKLRIVNDPNSIPKSVNLYLSRYMPMAFTTISIFDIETGEELHEALRTTKTHMLNPEWKYTGVGFGRSLNGKLFTYIILAY